MSPPPDPPRVALEIELRRTPIVRFETAPPLPPTPPRPLEPRVFRVYFATGEAVVRGSQQPEKRDPIAPVHDFLTREAHAPVTRIVCHGFTDNVGTAASNRTLSLQRANETARLIRAGLVGTVLAHLTVDVRGRGEDRLPTTPERADAAERRVDIEVEFQRQ